MYLDNHRAASRLGAICLVVLSILIVSDAWAQGLGVAQLSNVQCRQWDDAFLAIYDAAFWLTLLSCASLGLLLGLAFGRFSWLLAAPYKRVVVAAGAVLVLALLAVVVMPWFGLGTLWFSGIDPDYFACRDRTFDAQGFLGGRFGDDVAAIAQVPTMLLLLLVAASVGAVLGLGLTWLLARFSPLSLRASVS